MKNSKYYDESIIELKNHARVANEEMSVIKNDIGWMKGKFEDFDKRWDRLDNRIWAIIATTILGTLLSIAINVYFK